MSTQVLNAKRAQSENFSVRSNIISPSPVRVTPKLSFHIAREVFDMPSSLEDLDSNNFNENFPTFTRPKFYSLRLDSDSPNDWDLNSSCSTSNQGNQESPIKSLERNYLLTDISEEISSDIPRASNPIVHDVNFMRCNHDSFKPNYNGEAMISRS